MVDGWLLVSVSRSRGDVGYFSISWTKLPIVRSGNIIESINRPKVRLAQLRRQLPLAKKLEISTCSWDFAFSHLSLILTCCCFFVPFE